MLLPYGVALGPVRSRIEDAVSDSLRGKCHIDRLGFSWLSGVSAEGIRIDNPPGFSTERPAVKLRRLQADVALRSLLFGAYAATAEIDGLEVYVEQTADGATNLQQLAAESKSDSKKPTPKEPDKQAPPSDLAFDVRLTNSTIEVRRAGELLEAITDLNCHARSGKSSPLVEVDGEAKLRAGDVAIDVDYDLADATTDARLVSHGLDLTAFRPIVESFMPDQLAALEGRVDGDLIAKIRGSNQIELGGDLVVDAPRIAGPIVRGMDVRSERWTLAPHLALGADASSSVDASKFAVDLGWLQINGQPSDHATTVALSYQLDIAALAAFGGPMPEWLGTSGANLTGNIALPTADLPQDAAGWSKAVDATANLAVPSLDVAGFALRDLAATAAIKDGACSISTGESSRLDGGALIAKLNLDLANFDRLQTDLSLQWSGGQLHGGTTAALRYAVPMLAGLDPEIARIAGLCDLELSFAGPAMKAEQQTWIAWLNQWSGNGSLGLRNASFAPAQQLQGLLAPLGPLTKGKVAIANNGQLAIDSFTAPFSFAEGAVRTTAAKWLAKGKEIGLSGSIALDGAIDYSLDLTALLRGHRDGERVLKALNGTLPATKLKGTLVAPTLALPAVEDLAKKLLEGQGQDLLRRGLEGLFKK